MKRRRLLQLAGTVTGSGIIVGSGAFTTVSVKRSVSVAVADDEDSYLGLNGTSELGRSYDTGNPEEISFEIPGVQEDTPSDTAGSGLGPNSQYTLSDIVEITNQGDDTVVVWSQSSDLSSGVDDISLVNNSNNAETLDKKSNGVVLSPGEMFTAGLMIDTGSKVGAFDITLTILAEEP